jgi:NAD(P)-dependent dehydrogenase (short-subunit alcohol dehydrogenase family)
MTTAPVARTGMTLPPGHRTAVLGAGGALGSACVRAFASAGASVTALDLRAEAAEAAVQSLPGRHEHRTVDVTDPTALMAVARAVGELDSLVYAAGIVFDDEIVEMDWTQYRQLMAVNLDGAFYVAAAFGRPMIASKRQGAFVFISSTAGLRGEPSASAYCASKFGLIGMVESFAAELSRHGIRANAVCPGNVDSPLLRNVAAETARRQDRDWAEIFAEFAHAGSAQRLVQPDEVAQLCLFLASPAAAAITGAALRVDCGAMIG